MNKYTKNIIWFNLEKYITLAIVLGVLILTITCATSCTTSQTLSNHHSEYPCYFTK